MFDPNYSLWKQPRDYSSVFSDEWKAQCLNDYYQSIANNMAELEQALDESALANDIDDRIEQLSDILNGARMDAAAWYRNVMDERTAEALEIRTCSTQFRDILEDYFTNSAIGQQQYEEEISPNFSEGTQLTLHQICNEMAMQRDDQLIYNHSNIQDIIEDTVDEVMQGHGLQNSYVSFTAGNIKVKDLLTRYTTEVNLNLPTINGSSGWMLYDEAGEAISQASTVAKSWNIDMMKSELSALGASMSLWGNAMVACIKTNASERIAEIENKANDLLSTVKDKYGAAKEKFLLMKSKITQVLSDTRTNIQNITDTLTNLFEINKAYEAGDTLSDSPLAQYTGINPTTAIRFKGIGKVLGTTVYICAEAGKAIWNVIKTVAHKLFVKVRPWLNALTGAPEDIKVCDKDAMSFETDLFCFTRDNVERVIGFNSAVNAKNWADYMQKHTGKWIRFTTLFATTLIYYDRVIYFDNDPLKVYVWFNFRMKPKCMDASALGPYGLGFWTQYASGAAFEDYTRADNINDFINAVTDASFSNDLYAKDDFEEQPFDNGFRLGLYLQRICMMGFASDMACPYIDMSTMETYVSECPNKFWMGDLDDQYETKVKLDSNNRIDTFKIWDYDNNRLRSYQPYLTLFTGQNLTNKDVIQTVSGCKYKNGDYEYNSYPDINDVDPMEWYVEKVSDGTRVLVTDPSITDTLMVPSMIFLGNVLVNNEKYYIEDQTDPDFIPYSFLNNDFDPPRYQVRTDKENIRMATTLATVLVTVAIIAVAYFVTKGSIALLKNAKYARMKTKIGQLDNDMWQNGLVMNPIQTMKYKRWSRKLDKMGNCDLATASSTASGVDKLLSIATDQGTLLSQTPNVGNDTIDQSVSLYGVDQTDVNLSLLYKSITGAALES